MNAQQVGLVSGDSAGGLVAQIGRWR